MASSSERYPQAGFAESDYQPLPKKSKKYSYFDDGKIRPSRHSYMKILDVIPFAEANCAMIYFWEKMKKDADWVWADKTDYFIVGYEAGSSGYTTLFARMKDGYSWYGQRMDDPGSWWNGKLITNPYFNYEEFKEEVANAGW